MILGLSTLAFTDLHVTVSLLAIVSGVVVLRGLLKKQLHRRWNALFLVSASLTSATGFAFPNKHITPGIVVGGLSLVTIALASYALYFRRLAGAYRETFVVSTRVALYFNVFVLVTQLFRHVALFKALDPSGSGPAFAVAQLLALGVFTWLGWAAVKTFKPTSPVSPAPTEAHPRQMQQGY